MSETSNPRKTRPKKTVKSLEAALDIELQRSSEFENKYKRALADYVNLERRTETDIQNGINEKTDSLLRDFLDIYDDFIRARDVYRANGAETAGLDSILRNVESMLKRRGVDPIDSMHAPFDPTRHEAMLTKKAPDLDEQTVTSELRKGYIVQGRVLRTALVEISTKEDAD